MAAYEYLCMACEHRFEDRRPMTASVDTALACPSCGSERVRRQFSFVAGTAYRLIPGTDVVLQLHFVPTGKPDPALASVAFHFTDAAPSRPL